MYSRQIYFFILLMGTQSNFLHPLIIRNETRSNLKISSMYRDFSGTTTKSALSTDLNNFLLLQAASVKVTIDPRRAITDSMVEDMKISVTPIGNTVFINALTNTKIPMNIYNSDEFVITLNKDAEKVYGATARYKNKPFVMAPDEQKIKEEIKTAAETKAAALPWTRAHENLFKAIKNNNPRYALQLPLPSDLSVVSPKNHSTLLEFAQEKAGLGIGEELVFDYDTPKDTKWKELIRKLKENSPH